MTHILVFAIGRSRLALPLSVVEKVVWTVEITPLPEAPGITRGVIRFQGRVIRVLDLRQRLGLTRRDQIPDDRLIIARTSRHQVAVMADLIVGVAELSPKDLFPADPDLPWPEEITAMAKFDEELVPIYSLDHLLDLGVPEKGLEPMPGETGETV
jgi:purine-binding chemotaxis protein CheW